MDVTLGRAVELATERLVAPVQGMHRVIAARTFRSVGPAGAPVRVAHDAIAGITYAGVRGLAAVVGAALDRRHPRESAATATAHAWVNGLWGDELGRHRSALETHMTIRGPDGAGLAGADEVVALRSATGHVVVLVHGLVDTESCWGRPGDEDGLAHALDRHPLLTPVSVRYNTGRRIWENGAHLAGLLARLHARWPVEVQSVSLVGHSMGGLVVRAALRHGHAEGHEWVADVRRVVSVASPHRGAPLEKLVTAVARGLSTTASTRPLADFLNTRSAGITDLRFGAIAPGDWPDADPTTVLRTSAGAHPLPPGIAHHVVAGVVTASATHPVGLIAGDLVVRTASAAPRAWPTDVVTVGRVNHASMLRSRLVVEHVMGWLDPSSSAAAPTPALRTTSRGRARGPGR